MVNVVYLSRYQLFGNKKQDLSKSNIDLWTLIHFLILFLFVRILLFYFFILLKSLFDHFGNEIPLIQSYSTEPRKQ